MPGGSDRCHTRPGDRPAFHTLQSTRTGRASRTRQIAATPMRRFCAASHGRPAPRSAGTCILGHVPSVRQTSVLVSAAAGVALAQVAQRWGVSRDAAVRKLLVSFIERQRVVVEDLRTTHISTVLNHPQCLEPGSDKPARHRLTFRAQPRVVQEAASLAYRVPGHARRQAHRDYASRPLTDALLTALAREQRFTEEGLGGLPDVLQWREADGLWRLTVAATLTQTERVIRSHGATDLVAMLEDAEVVWHSSWRAEVALHLAVHLFTGPTTEENRRWVGEQRAMFHTEMESLSDPRVIFGGHEFTDGAPTKRSSAEGRAATAVWRGQRRLALDALAGWFVAGPTASATVEPPGWTLTQPNGWRARRMSSSRPLPPGLGALVERGAVLRLTAGRAAVLWPLTSDGRPVPGVNQVIAGGLQLQLSPIQIAEALLVAHLEPTVDVEDSESADHLSRYPVMGVQTAFEAGLVDVAERNRGVLEAQKVTELRIRAFLGRAHRDKYPAEDLRQLHDAQRDSRAFARVAADLDLRFWITEPMWTWEVLSVPELLAKEATPAQLEVRGREWCRHVRLALERGMHQAWNEAMWEVTAARENDPDVEVWYSP